MQEATFMGSKLTVDYCAAGLVKSHEVGSGKINLDLSKYQFTLNLLMPWLVQRKVPLFVHKSHQVN